jgi:hypothetical protein
LSLSCDDSFRPGPGWSEEDSSGSRETGAGKLRQLSMEKAISVTNIPVDICLKNFTFNPFKSDICINLITAEMEIHENFY